MPQSTPFSPTTTRSAPAPQSARHPRYLSPNLLPSPAVFFVPSHYLCDAVVNRRASASIGGSTRRPRGASTHSPSIHRNLYSHPFFGFYFGVSPRFPRFQSANAVFAPKLREKTCKNRGKTCENRGKTCKNRDKTCQNLRKLAQTCPERRAASPLPNPR